LALLVVGRAQPTEVNGMALLQMRDAVTRIQDPAAEGNNDTEIVAAYYNSSWWDDLFSETHAHENPFALPVYCLTYGVEHHLVQKQLEGETLTRHEAADLIEIPSGHRYEECQPAPGTEMIRMGTDSAKCIEQGKLYTVCYDETGDFHTGSWRCGIFRGGAGALRQNGNLDCLGGCNEGQRSCNVYEHRGACMTHDVCSLVLDARGFTSHKHCGNEASHAVRTGGKCRSGRW